METYNLFMSIASSIVNVGITIFDRLFTPLKDWKMFDNTIMQEFIDMLADVPIIGDITNYSLSTYLFSPQGMFLVITLLIAYFFIP